MVIISVEGDYGIFRFWNPLLTLIIWCFSPGFPPSTSHNNVQNTMTPSPPPPTKYPGCLPNDSQKENMFGKKMDRTWLFQWLCQQKISRSNRTSEKVLLVFWVEWSQICVQFLQSHLWYQFQAFVAIFQWLKDKIYQGWIFLPFTQTMKGLVCPFWWL